MIRKQIKKEIVARNMDKTLRELGSILGLTIRGVFNLKKEIKDEQKNKQ